MGNLDASTLLFDRDWARRSVTVNFVGFHDGAAVPQRAGPRRGLNQSMAAGKCGVQPKQFVNVHTYLGMHKCIGTTDSIISGHVIRPCQGKVRRTTLPVATAPQRFPLPHLQLQPPFPIVPLANPPARGPVFLASRLETTLPYLPNQLANCAPIGNLVEDTTSSTPRHLVIHQR